MDNDSEEILGIDYGEKRIGISISMLNKKIAIPHSIIEYTNKEKAIKEINEIVAKNKIVVPATGGTFFIISIDTGEVLFSENISSNQQLPKLFHSGDIVANPLYYKERLYLPCVY